MFSQDTKRSFSNCQLPCPDDRQKVTDEEVFAAAQRAMSRRGPHELTLADIAGEAGVTPGRLVQRFGSKRALLVTLSERFAGSAGPSSPDCARPTAARSRRCGPTRPAWRIWPRRRMRSCETWPTCRATSPTTCSAGISSRTHGRRRREIEALLKAAIAAGELRRDVDVRALARTVETVIGGSLMSWATYREGKAVDWIGQDVEAVLAPWLRRLRSRGASASLGTRAEGSDDEPCRATDRGTCRHLRRGTLRAARGPADGPDLSRFRLLRRRIDRGHRTRGRTLQRRVASRASPVPHPFVDRRA